MTRKMTDDTGAGPASETDAAAAPDTEATPASETGSGAEETSDYADVERATDRPADSAAGEPVVETDVTAGLEKGGDDGEFPSETVVEARDLSVYYGDEQALRDVNMAIPGNRVTAIIGPSGCGKSTFLRCINRMNDLVDAARVEGELLFRGKDVYDDDVDPVALRRRIGMVFQQPNPFPKSIYDNVAYGLRVQNRTENLVGKVEQAL